MKLTPTNRLNPTLAILFGLGVLTFSAGALAQDSDADGVVDGADARPCDPQIAGVQYSPAQGQHGGILFEDEWPALGDADFNDAVLTYNYLFSLNSAGEIVGITATFNALALGGDFSNGLGLQLPIAASDVTSVVRVVGTAPPQQLVPTADAQLTVRVSDNLRELFGNQSGPINAVSGPSVVGQTVQVHIQLGVPVAATIAGLAPFDVFLFRSARPGHEVHSPSYSGTSNMDSTLFRTMDDGSNAQSGTYFVDGRGLPFSLHIPVFDRWPQEGLDIGLLYPDIGAFAASGGASNQDFYLTNVQSGQAYAGVPPLLPAFLAGHDSVDTACVVVNCASDYEDCDGDPSNGCEAHLTHSAGHCGACGITCGQGDVCSGAACVRAPSVPLVEVCDGADNDANGQVDDGLVISCQSTCGSGQMSCVNGAWTACSAPIPAPETCNGVDDNCNGVADEGFFPGCHQPTCGPANGVAPTVQFSIAPMETIISSRFAIPFNVADSDLDSWVVDIKTAGANNYLTLATGSGVATEAFIDPELHPNGFATLRLRAMDCEGNFNTIEQDVEVRRANKLGSTYLSFDDMSVHVGGVPLQVRRSYDSKRRQEVGDFGHGWSLNIGPEVSLAINHGLANGWNVSCGASPSATELSPHVVEVRVNDFKSYRFVPQLTHIRQGGPNECIADLTFVHVGGSPGRLYGMGGGVPMVVWSGGALYGADGVSPPTLGYLSFSTPNGDSYDLDPSGAVIMVRDAFGNWVGVDAQSIVHSTGVSFALGRDGQGRITSITDPMGYVRTYSYSTSGDLRSATDQAGGVETYSYEGNHQLVYYRAADGSMPLRIERNYGQYQLWRRYFDANQNSYNIDVYGGAMAINAPGGLSGGAIFPGPSGEIASALFYGLPDIVTYDSFGNATHYTDRNGITIDRQFDHNNNLVSETNARGQMTSRAIVYAAGARKVSEVVTYPDYSTLDIRYGPGEKATQVTHPNGRTNRIVYNSMGLPVSFMALGAGNFGYSAPTTVQYDGAGRATRVSDPQGRVVTRSYNANGWVTAYDSERRLVEGQIVTENHILGYDPMGRITSKQNPAGSTAVATRNVRGQLAAATDYSGRTTSYGYDPNGGLTSVGRGSAAEWTRWRRDRKVDALSDADGVTVQYESYQDLLLGRGEANGGTLQNWFDGTGKLTLQNKASGASRMWNYDNAGRVTAVVDGQGRSTQRFYDVMGRLTGFGSSSSSYRYGIAGEMENVVHADRTGRNNSFDAFGNLTSSQDENGRVTNYQYDAMNRLGFAQDASGQYTTFSYDTAGNLTSMNPQSGGATYWGYDFAGNRTSEYGSTGTRTWAYDGAGRKTSSVDVDLTSHGWQYDAAGFLTQRTANGVPIATQTRTPAGRLNSAANSAKYIWYLYTLQGALGAVQSPYAGIDLYRDIDGQVTSRLVFNGAAYGDETYEYDGAGDLVVALPNQRSLAEALFATYTPNGQIQSAARSNTDRTYYGYDARNRLVEVRHTILGVESSYVYGYDATGRRTQVLETTQGLGTPTTTTQRSFAYDAAYRLTRETGPSGTLTYGYDARGNRTSITDANGTVSSLYGVDDQLVSVGGVPVGYDVRGNLIALGAGPQQTSYAYDTENHLTSVTLASGLVVAYEYDALGYLAQRTEAGIAKNILIDPTPEHPTVVGIADNGSDAILYSHLPGTILRYGTGAGNYLLSDGQSVRLESTAGFSSSIAATYDYDAFGGLLSSTGSTQQDFGLHGEWMDATTGLVYMRARWFDPRIGRFLTRDTIPAEPGDFVNSNPYAFPGQDPVNLTDPSGHYATVITEAFGGAEMRPLRARLSALADPMGRGAGVEGPGDGFARASGLEAFGAGGAADRIRKLAEMAVGRLGVSFEAQGLPELSDGGIYEFDGNRTRRDRQLVRSWAHAHPFATYDDVGEFIIDVLEGKTCKSAGCNRASQVRNASEVSLEARQWPFDWKDRIRVYAAEYAKSRSDCTGPGDGRPGC